MHVLFIQPAHTSSNLTLKLEADKKEQAGRPTVVPQLSCMFVSVSPSVVMSPQGGALRSHAWWPHFFLKTAHHPALFGTQD